MSTIKLNADQLRKNVIDSGQAAVTVKRNDIYIILDNVLDTYNIGSIFRLADAVAAKKLFLCGNTETPPNHRIKKASINTTEWVDWEYCESAVEAIEKVKSFVAGAPQDDNLQVIGIEQTDRSIIYTNFEYKLPIALIVGHESDGVSKDVLKICDRVVELPMFGVNISLNVMVSLGVVLYQILQKTTTSR